MKSANQLITPICISRNPTRFSSFLGSFKFQRFHLPAQHCAVPYTLYPANLSHSHSVHAAHVNLTKVVPIAPVGQPHADRLREHRVATCLSSRPPARAPRTNRIWRACARPFPRQSMDMALAFCPPTEPFRAARRRAGPCGGHIAHGQALEGSVARYRSCHSVLIANVGSIRRVCHSNHVLNQTAARPKPCS